MAHGTEPHGTEPHGTDRAPTVRMGVFGGAWVSANGNRVRPTSAKQAALLSLLISQPGTPVGFETAADALWPDCSDAQGRRSLRVHMSSLRKWLRETCGADAGDLIETHRLGYRLNIAPDCLDWQIFADQVDRGRRLFDLGDHAGALSQFTAATESWAEPFPELLDCPLVEGRRTFLTMQCELAHDEMIEAQLLLGEAARVVSALQERVVVDPYRERSCEQLMRALYASGSQAAALDVYRALYRRLRDDLGIEPGPQIRDTQAEILSQNLQRPSAPTETVGPHETGDAGTPDATLIDTTAVSVAEIVDVVLDALSDRLAHADLGPVGVHVRDVLTGALPQRRSFPAGAAGARCGGRPNQRHWSQGRGVPSRL